MVKPTEEQFDNVLKRSGKKTTDPMDRDIIGAPTPLHPRFACSPIGAAV
jgi:hypothetical protein